MLGDDALLTSQRLIEWVTHAPELEEEVAPPSGTFSPTRTPVERHVLIAAGSGITPVLSIASAMLRDSDWWLCEPYGMVVDAQAVLTEAGVQRQRIHRELFYVEDIAPPPVRHVEPPAAGPLVDLTLTLDGRTATIAIARDVAILDAVRQVRGSPVRLQRRGVRNLSSQGRRR